MGSIRKTYEEAQKTREEILRAGIAACTRSGNDGLSQAQVAEEAGVTRGALYRHFAGKKRLLREMVETLLADMGAAIETAANREADGWAALEAGCRCFFTGLPATGISADCDDRRPGGAGNRGMAGIGFSPHEPFPGGGADGVGGGKEKSTCRTPKPPPKRWPAR